jgi:hypothetical protein
MNKGCILYLTSNDGSDMRINKEIKSLSKYSDIIFLGIGESSNCYVEPLCKRVYLIRGKRNSPLTIIKLVLQFLKVLIKEKINSVHIINEQLFIFFYPFLFKKHTVLDLFDSIFLMNDLGGEKFKWFKQILYFPANSIIVTDENRLMLFPSALRYKCFILPNYPEYLDLEIEKETSNELRILFNGWMGEERGTNIVEGLLRLKLPIKVYMAGWFSDSYTRSLVDRYPDHIKFLGVIPQKQALLVAQQKADYILCVYAPTNQNSINASPNKVYDAIHTATPLIINAEVKISKWIAQFGIGYVIKRYNVDDFKDLYKNLIAAKGTFKFDQSLKESFSWEKVEKNLLKAHKVI